MEIRMARRKGHDKNMRTNHNKWKTTTLSNKYVEHTSTEKKGGSQTQHKHIDKKGILHKIY
jgi:hypothetical protein